MMSLTTPSTRRLTAPSLARTLWASGALKSYLRIISSMSIPPSRSRMNSPRFA